MNSRWIGFIAARYLFPRHKKSPSPVLSILGIATGVLALIVIIAVMNGFQLSFIESILEISSYHLRVASIPQHNIEYAQSILLALPGIEAVVPFREFQGLARGRRGGQQAALVRGIPPNTLGMDAGFAGRLDFELGSFNLESGQNAVVGAELANRLGVRDGDMITLFSIPSIFSAVDSDGDSSEGSQVFTVTGVFRTGFYEYDMNWVFIDVASARDFTEAGITLGVKLRNRFHDRQALELAGNALRSIQGFEDVQLSSWRDYNRSFFGALRTEKLFMFILVGLIFIVVALNIYQAQRRSVLEHHEEIGLLRAIGGGEHAVRMIFVFDGAFIGFIGAASGLIAGLLISLNISLFFTVIESTVNFFISIINNIAIKFGAGDLGGFSIFSPAVFYIKEIPSRIIPVEALIIFMFGFLSALLAAWFASRKVSRVRPAEVLRYE